jgi:TP901 family phage tail tape measure protein
MAGRFTIWTDFKVGRTETSKEIRQMRGQLSRLEDTASGAMSTMKGFLGAQVIGKSIHAASMGLAEVTRQFVDFDQSVTGAAARWGPAFDRGTEGFDKLADAARRTGAATEHTAAQAGSMLQFMAMAGFEAEEAIGLMPDVANLATAANLDFARSSDIASDALGAFGMSGGTTQEKISGFRKIVDQATKSTNMSNQTLEMWFEAIREGGPAFTNAGQDMATLNASLGVLANSGKKGATSGYLLRNAILRLASPTGKAAGLLDDLGVAVEEDGKFRNFIDILGDLEQGLSGMSDAERSAALDEIFGKRAVTGIQILLQEGKESLKEYEQQIRDSAGASEEIADKMRDSVGNRIKKIQSAAIELGFKLFDAFGPRIEQGIQRISDYLDDANSNAGPFIDTVTEIGEAFGDVLGFIIENRDHIIRLIKAWAILKAGMIIGGTVVKGLNGVNTALEIMHGNAGMATKGVQSLTTSLTGAQAVIGGVTAALSAGLALGNMLWESIEANERKARDLANRAYKLNQELSPDVLEGYSDKNLARMANLERETIQKDHGWFDLDAEEHGELKDAARDTLRKIQDEQRRRREINRQRDIAGLAPAEFGNAAYVAGNSTVPASTRKETVTRKEVRHTLALEDKEKRATLKPADPGIMK